MILKEEWTSAKKITVSIPSRDHLRENAGKSLEAGGQEGDSSTYPGERCLGFEQAGQWLKDKRGSKAEVLCCRNTHHLVVG